MSETVRQTCGSYKDYLNSLTLSCPQPGEPGKLVWKPDDKTPDVVYYQVTMFLSVCLSLSLSLTHTHTHTHTLSLCVYIIFFACVTKGERERESDSLRRLWRGRVTCGGEIACYIVQRVVMV